MKCRFFTLLVALFTIGLSYGQEAEPKPEPEVLKVANYSFSISEPWVSQPAGGMRSGVLRFTQTDEKLEAVDAVFFHFGGSVEANIDRWKKQFVENFKTNTETKEVNGTKVTYFNGSGTFMNSMGGGPFAPKTKQEGMAVLAAILPSEEEGKLVFVKITGPAASVEAAKTEFTKLVESAL